MKLIIKNMVCDRCIMVVKGHFEKLGIETEEVLLGHVKLKLPLVPKQLEEVKQSLEPLGFELIDDKRGRLIESIKNVIRQNVHFEDHEKRVSNYSDIIAEKVGKDYHYLSNLFSEIEGTTIERYIIQQKIEKVKEFLVYDELSLSEIAYKMGYSSVAHLSNQFKKTTGLTPSHFKKIGNGRRLPIDKV